MKKIAIIGHFCAGKDVSDGQSVKTRIVTEEIEKALGTENVARIDTYGWKKNPLKLLAKCIWAVWNSRNVVFMTDAGGIKVFPWLLLCANAFNKRTIHYVVIGGWLVHFLEKHEFLASCLRRLNGIFVETSAMRRGLENLGFQNVYLMPNFKALSPLTEDQLCYATEEPYKFCTFSRIMREKGIEDAVKAVQSLNAEYGRSVCTLDIFGQVDADQVEWFKELSAAFPPEIQYCGIVPFEKSVNVLKEYHALLFPTKFYTEGIPGTIIDAYAAGIPVVASEWEGFSDIVDPGLTGIGVPFDKPECLTDVLQDLIHNPLQVHTMKEKCLVKARQYTPSAVIDILLSELS